MRFANVVPADNSVWWVWAMDLQFDVTTAGRPIAIVSIID
jgi:hypothetical protein